MGGIGFQESTQPSMGEVMIEEGVVSGDHPQESLLLIHAAVEHQGISQAHYEMCICRSSHSSAASA